MKYLIFKNIKYYRENVNVHKMFRSGFKTFNQVQRPMNSLAFHKNMCANPGKIGTLAIYARKSPQ
jgi:hypothetical protein